MTEKKKNSIASVAYKPSKKRPSHLPTHCQHDKCIVKLSIYNMTNYCVMHERLHADLKQHI